MIHIVLYFFAKVASIGFLPVGVMAGELLNFLNNQYLHLIGVSVKINVPKSDQKTINMEQFDFFGGH